MSFMRGDFYVWVGGFECDCGDHCTNPSHSYIALWLNENRIDGLQMLDARHYGHDGGIYVPLDLFDELVVMRHAELVAEGNYEPTRERAVRKWSGNGGCWDLLSPAERDAEMNKVHRALADAKKERV